MIHRSFALRVLLVLSYLLFRDIRFRMEIKQTATRKKTFVHINGWMSKNG